MKKLLLILLCLPIIGFAQKTYVPDDNFEAYLESNGMGDGIALNDSVLTNNVNSVNALYIAFQSISDLTGIEDFTSLVDLDCRNNQLTSLDFSQNTALTILECNNNNITTIDVSNNTNLTTLYCNINQITILDVSNNTNLTYLSCSYNELTMLDVSNGNNTNMILLANGNNNLFCIQVDDVLWSISNWTVSGNNIDSWMSFSTDCSTAFGCSDSCAINYNSLVIIDDSSCTYPVNTTTVTAANNYTWNGVTYTESGIYEVSSSPGNIGDYYQGGVIFYLDGNGGGFVSDISDLCNAYWGCPWVPVNTNYNNGEQNTIEIMAQCGDPIIAARLCDNSYNQGYSDWYLPAKGQLDDMYNNKIEIDNESLLNGGDAFLTGNNDFYLSSSDYSPNQISNSVHSKKFANGSDAYGGKSNPQNIRAIRSISTIPTSINGCDSTAILNLTITNPTTPTVNNTSSLLSTSACDSFTWNNNTYYASGIYSDTSTYSTGCINIDSLELIINNSTSNSTNATVCDYYIWAADGNTYNSTGTYTYLSNNSAGCLHTETLNLTINNSTSSSMMDTACGFYTWSTNGNTYTSSGIYTSTSTNSLGCIHTDSLVLTITINNVNLIITSSNISCNGLADGSIVSTTTGGISPYQYSLDGGPSQTSGTFTNLTSGSYYIDVTDSNGCISSQSITIIEPNPLNVSIYYLDSLLCYDDSIASIVAIPYGGTLPYSFNWTSGQITDTVSNLSVGNYTVFVVDNNGCSDFTTININSPSAIISNNNLNGCDSVLIGSNYYSISGVYTDTLTSVNGCDSIVNTNLTLGQNTASYDTLSVVASIVWNGMSLSVSGDYSVTLFNSVGCDSIVNLNLTITTTGISDLANNKTNLIKITDILGKETSNRKNTTLFYIYDDGTVEKRITID